MRLTYAPRWFHIVSSGLLAALALTGADVSGAQARAVAEGASAHGKHESPSRVVHDTGYRPPFAAIVVDDNTGQAIHEVNADEPRHPASLTKIMTLYVLFEQIEAGKFTLDTPLQVSSHAAGQAPVKLGLKPGQTITVDEAIRAMATKSANDAAAVVGEAIGDGDEAEGARLMTLKAKALGMASTTYVNTSGLPAEEQITTARDQALLGLAIRNRFPELYRYFSTLSFNYHGREMHNHNTLLGTVPGVERYQDGLHRGVRAQPGGIGAPRRSAHRRRHPGRHVERRARRPYASADRGVHALRCRPAQRPPAHGSGEPKQRTGRQPDRLGSDRREYWAARAPQRREREIEPIAEKRRVEAAPAWHLACPRREATPKQGRPVRRRRSRYNSLRRRNRSPAPPVAAPMTQVPFA